MSIPVTQIMRTVNRITNLNDEHFYEGKVMTTRSNGNIYIIVDSDGLSIMAEKASPNHTKLED